MRFKLPALCALAVLPVLPMMGEERAIDTQRSAITIHVAKAGLFSVVAHDHSVSAPVASGIIGNDNGAEKVEFKIQSAKLMVKADPKVDDKTRAQMQKDMEELTLEPAKYPEIAFVSTHVRKMPDGQFKVDGTLTLHGISRPVSVNVKREGESYTGHTVIQQTDFGIKPISMAGGTIRIKDPLDIDFQVFAAPAR